jgi:DNA repair exonuclease SbcCD nuclease subunit
MRILRVGDPHVKPNNMAESQKLLQFIHDMVLQQKPDRLEILGDLFHTHSMLRLEVVAFWDSWLDRLSDIVETVVIVGNHDQSGDYSSRNNALSVFKRIVKPTLHIVENSSIKDGVAYMAYYHGNEEFIAQANKLKLEGGKYLVCHATFDGSKYESGTYAPDGIDPAKIEFDLIISGHIHSTQRIERGNQVVIYPGTAKWDTLSDANEKKGIWLFEHDDITGKILKETIFPTNEICTPIVSLQWQEGTDMPAFPEKAKVSIELVGSSDWVAKQRAILKGTVSLQSKITDKSKRSDRNAGKSFADFLLNLYKSSTDRAALLEYAKELGFV